VHIASHSQVNSIDPLFSQIYLHDLESGFADPLYAYELFNLSLNTELLVLSSCESGSGSYTEGSGIIGLGRALNFAGAQSLILNSWSIRDKTASDIMIAFYESLSFGYDKDTSLRNAKLNYINSVNSNPAVWGSLILFGNPDSIHKKTEHHFYLIFGFLLLIAIGYVVRRFYFIKSR
jgi:CHAT domain-containing protein